MRLRLRYLLKGAEWHLRYWLREPIMSRLRAWKYRHMPVAMITGTAGKTTTTRLTASIMKAAGHRVGAASTGGVEIDGQLVVKANETELAGHPGHRKVFKTPGVTAAVLETTRIAIMRFGFYVQPIMAGAVTNVGRDHIGLDGIDTVEQMAEVKRRVTDRARRCIVLDGDNDQTLALAARYPPSKVTLTFLDADNPAAAKHLSAGGQAIVRSGENRLVHIDPAGLETDIVAVEDVPVTLGGRSAVHISDAMIAAALGLGMGADVDAVRRGLIDFQSNLETNPGRFNIIEDYDFLLILDRLMNGHAIKGMGDTLEQIAGPGKRILCCSMPGNRARVQYQEVGEGIANLFDMFVIYEMEGLRRGLPEGQITQWIANGLKDSHVSEDRIHRCVDRDRALALLAEHLGEGDTLVLIADVPDDLPAIAAAFEKHLSGKGNPR